MRNLAGIVCLTLSIALVSPSKAQCAGHWVYGPDQGMPGVGGRSNPNLIESARAATMWDPDGDGPASSLAVVAGHFTAAGRVRSGHVAAWNGFEWSAFGAGVNGVVLALTVYNGDLIAGGTFSRAGGLPASNVARWDGTAWHALGAGVDGPVNSLTVYQDELIAAGSFSNAGGASARSIARWNGAAWSPLATGITSTTRTVNSLTVHDSRLIVAGGFTQAGGVNAKNIAAWDGSAWNAIGAGLSGFSTVYEVDAVTVFDGELYAGGDFQFSESSSRPVKDIARWDGELWQPAGYLDGAVRGLGAWNNQLIAAGTFYIQAGSTEYCGVAAWDGSAWQAIGPMLHDVAFAACDFEGDLILLGQFRAIGSANARCVARWDGTAWQAMGTGINAGAYNLVASLGVHQNRLYLGGDFTGAGDVQAGFIAAWDGAAWDPLSAGMTGADPFKRVSAITEFGDDLIAGGDFDTAGGVPAVNIARWSAAAWSAIPSLPTSDVHCFAVNAGHLYVGTGEGVQRWDGAGRTIIGMANSTVEVLIWHNDMLIAGGQFERIGDQGASRVARWDGTAWQPMGAGFTDIVNALAIYKGEVIAAGYFYGGSAGKRISRWDGSSWQPLASGLDGTVHALAVYGDHLYAGGEFATAGGVAASCIARWDGAAWSPLAGGVNGKVLDLIVFRGELIAGGVFTEADGQVSAYWARWKCSCVADLNGDGEVDFADYLEFLNLYDTQDPRADFNQDGFVDFADYLEFLNLYEAGC